jgi:transposase
LKLAFELGSTKWTLGVTSSPAQRPRLRTIAAGDLVALAKEIALAKARFGLPGEMRVQSCYAAGRDGFWLPRWVTTHGAENVVVEASSIEVNRRARRAKTDRLDVGKLLALLLRWLGGERKVWRVIHVPTPAAEAQRPLTRELDTVREDRKRVRNRIQGVLATQGIRLPLTGDFLELVRTAQTGDGRPLPEAFHTRLEREWAHLDAIEARLDALTAARDEQIATGTDRVATVARQLCTLRAVAETSAAVFSAELFGTRTFSNGRQLGALLGLVPVP